MALTGLLAQKEAELKEKTQWETQLTETGQLWILRVMWNKIRCNYNGGI
jgi:hypothetical protein